MIHSDSSSSSYRTGRPTSQSSSSSSFRDIQRFGAGISEAFVTPVTYSFSASHSSADVPLPDSRPESTHSSSFKFGAGDSMADTERGNTSPAQRSDVPRKRPFSFMITGAPRWTWVHALVLAISLIAIGCSIAAIVLSLQHHGHSQAVAGSDVSASAASWSLSSGVPDATPASTAKAPNGESRSSNKPRSASSSTEAEPPPSPSPSTQSVSAAAATSSLPPSTSPSADNAVDTSPAATSPTTTAPIDPTETHLSAVSPWTSFTVPDPTATWAVSWSAGAPDALPKVTAGQAYRGESIWPSSEPITRAAYVGGRPFYSSTSGSAPTEEVEGGGGGVPGVAADEGGEGWPHHGLVHEFGGGGGGGDDDMPRFAKYQNAALKPGKSSMTELPTFATRPSVTAMPCFANSTMMTMTYGRTA